MNRDDSMISPEDFEILIREVDARRLVQTIKENHAVAERVFQGFRKNVQSVKTPAVRQRIVREIAESDTLSKLITSLWEDTHKPILDLIDAFKQKDIELIIPSLIEEIGGTKVYLALLIDGRKGLRKLAETRRTELLDSGGGTPSDSQAGSVSREIGPSRQDAAKAIKELKAAKEKIAALQKRNKELEQKLKSAERTITRDKKELARMHEEIHALQREEKESARRAVRLSRELERSEQQRQDLERRIKELRHALDSSEAAHSESLPMHSISNWEDAVKDLHKKKKYQSAIDFLEAMAGLSGDERVHENLRQSYRQTGQAEQEFEELMWLANHYLSTGKLSLAFNRVCRAIVLQPCSDDAKKMLQSIFGRLDVRNERRMSTMRRALAEVRREDTETAETILQLARKTSLELAAALTEAPASDEADHPFLLKASGRTLLISPREIVQVIERNESEKVRFLQSALRTLVRSSEDDYNAIMSAIRAIDPSCCTTLVEATKPIVVDASNVAHRVQTKDGKPKLSSILSIRTKCREHGYFPVYLCADAALPHQIDRPSELWKMINAGEIELSDAYSDADEMILDRARSLNCPVVTRDQMTDWDPEGRIPKIRFDVDDGWAELFEN